MGAGWPCKGTQSALLISQGLRVEDELGFRPRFPVWGRGGYVWGERGELLLGWGCWAHTRKPGRRGQPGGAGVERGGGDTGSLLGHLLLCWAPASPLGMLGIYMSISIYRKDNTHRDSCCLSLAAQLVSSRARIQG